MNQPNILLVITDQQRVDHLGCYGHPVVKTPNIDSIAKKGTRFERFYVSTPVCMPNRATLMTGRMPSVHGVRHNGIPLSRSSVTFVEVLKSFGYRTALIGKSHLQTQTGRPPISHGESSLAGRRALPEALREARKGIFLDGSYDEESPNRWKAPDAKVDVPFYGFDYVELCKGHGDLMTGDYLRWLRGRHPFPESIVGPNNQLPGNVYSVPQAWRTAVPEDLYSTAFIAERVESYLSQFSDNDDGHPFFLMASFPDPHHPFTPPGRYWDMYQPRQMPVPTAFQRDDWAPPPHVAELIDAYNRGERSDDPVMAHGICLEQALEARALTCGSITCIDDAVGRMIRTLQANDLEKDTIVIFTSDHGEHLGDHRLLLKGLAHYDELLRVPCIWCDPRQTKTGAVTKALAGTIDLSATILDRLGFASYNGFQGVSLLPIIEKPDSEVRSAILIEDENQRSVAGLGPKPRERTLVTKDWRMSIFLGHNWGELYDLGKDPGEFDNLWNSIPHQKTKAVLMEILTQKLTDTCDRCPAPLHQA